MAEPPSSETQTEAEQEILPSPEVTIDTVRVAPALLQQGQEVDHLPRH